MCSGSYLFVDDGGFIASPMVVDGICLVERRRLYI